MPIYPSPIPVAAAIVDGVTNVAGAMLALTGLLAAALRAGAVLTKSPPEKVEWLTALGFLWGLMMALMSLVLDLLIR